MLRTLTSVTALKLYALILSVWGIGQLVWVSKIYENFLKVGESGFSSALTYVLYAASHTTIAVQLVLVVAAVAFISLATDILRARSGTQLLAV